MVVEGADEIPGAVADLEGTGVDGVVPNVGIAVHEVVEDAGGVAGEAGERLTLAVADDEKLVHASDDRRPVHRRRVLRRGRHG